MAYMINHQYKRTNPTSQALSKMTLMKEDEVCFQKCLVKRRYVRVFFFISVNPNMRTLWATGLMQGSRTIHEYP